VSNVLNPPACRGSGTRETVTAAMERLGYVRGAPGTPSPVMDEQMGHSDGSVQARYPHATPNMVRRLLDGLTAVWENALDARRQPSPGSPMAVLDGLPPTRSSPKQVRETEEAGPRSPDTNRRAAVRRAHELSLLRAHMSR